MKEPDLHKSVSQKLMEFDSMGALMPSADWDKAVMERLASTSPYTPARLTKGRIAAVVLFFLIINLGFILNTLYSAGSVSSQRNTELQLISKELLISQTISGN